MHRMKSGMALPIMRARKIDLIDSVNADSKDLSEEWL